MKIIFLGCILALLPATLAASSYGSVVLKNIDVVAVTDGKSFRVDIKQWQPIIGEDIGVWVRDISIPQIDGLCEREKQLANDAKTLTSKLLMEADEIELQDIGRDLEKFGLIADVNVDSIDLGRALVEAGLAYDIEDAVNYNWCSTSVEDLSYKDGRFSGDIVDGIPQGIGSWVSDDGAEEYTGEWFEGLWHGQGTHKGRNGAITTGQYQKGNRHGDGSWTHPDGRSYVGEFVDNQMDGQGVHTFANGDIYSGTFVKGKQHGNGTYTFADGSVVFGDWKQGKPWFAEYSNVSGRVIGTYVEGKWVK